MVPSTTVSAQVPLVRYIWEYSEAQVDGAGELSSICSGLTTPTPLLTAGFLAASPAAHTQQVGVNGD